MTRDGRTRRCEAAPASTAPSSWRDGSATPTAGQLFELDAIAAAFIGGVSPAGGIGTVMGSLIGALVYMSLTSGMNLMQTDISLQYIVRGLVLAAAVIFDVTTRSRGK